MENLARFACTVLVLAAFGCSCATAQTKPLPVRTISDIPLSGRASRLDYLSLDPQAGRLYIAHLGDSMMTVFDLRTQKVIGDVRDLKNVHGVLAVPELHRIYASATGSNELAAIDDKTLQVVARVPTGDYPDGIAYSSQEKKLYVSNMKGKSDTVIDANTNRVIGTIPLSGEVGNTQYDGVSERIYVAVSDSNEVVEIDPRTDKIVGAYPLNGCKGAHGLLIDGERGFAFAACEDNSKLAMLDLKAKKLVQLYDVGSGPDVLAFDPGLKRIYVSAESGVVTIFDEKEGRLEINGRDHLAAKAHTVAVDPSTHRVYFPLENVNGKPVLRIVEAI